MEWISVKERLPESSKCVLLFSKNGGVAEGAWDESERCFVQWRWSAKNVKATHWMPLPEPPKADQQTQSDENIPTNLEPQPSETNEFTCLCRKQKGWISENQITAPCPHCGRIYKGSYSQQYLKIIAVEQQPTQKSCEGCEHYLTTKENPLVVCNIRSCKDYSHYQARK